MKYIKDDKINKALIEHFNQRTTMSNHENKG